MNKVQGYYRLRSILEQNHEDSSISYSCTYSTIVVSRCFFSFLPILQPLKENRFVIPKSRYDSISTYLSPEGIKYSDIDLVYDKEIYQQLVDGGE